MLQRPLPSFERQVTNLVAWAAAQVEDDRLAVIELPDKEDLTAVVGTLDGARVDEMLSYARDAGLVKLDSDSSMSITPWGWKRLKPDSDEAQENSPAIPETSSPSDVIEKAHCNRCHGIKNSWVRAEHTVDGRSGVVSWSDSYQVLQSCGCDSLSVRHQFWFSEWDEMVYDEYGQLSMRRGIKETYYPAPTLREKPVWCDSISDEVLRSVLDELYLALNADLKVLASVGARTLLDRAGYLLLGDDPRGGFEGKLAALVSGGFISSQEKGALDAVADAGSASAHRGYTPDPERLGHIVDIIENFIHRAFILTSAAQAIRGSTPPRK